MAELADVRPDRGGVRPAEVLLVTEARAAEGAVVVGNPLATPKLLTHAISFVGANVTPPRGLEVGEGTGTNTGWSSSGGGGGTG